MQDAARKVAIGDLHRGVADRRRNRALRAGRRGRWGELPRIREAKLIPTLRRGDVVIMDNLRVHKVQGIRQTIRAAGAKLLFLPKYSPDLNPIEMMFAKLKALLRGAAESTVEATWRKIGSLVGAFTPAECTRYIRHAGYCGSS